MTRPADLSENVALAPLTTFQVGGAARFFVSVSNETEVVEAVEFARANGLQVFILGGGSNLLVSDNGFDGLVISIAIKGIERDGETVTAGAGEDWDDFCGWCVGNGLAGIECLSGIPGLVGGTPVQNVGAYGQEVSESIESVRVLDLGSGRIFDLSNAECGFGYRRSIFNTTHRGKFVVLAVRFRLNPGGAPKIAYKDLQRYFGDRTPTLSETREAVRAIRSEKGMLVRQGGADAQSAGSFFKNPIVTTEDFHRIEAEFADVPSFPAEHGMRKVPAAWLIERAGFEKGFRLGNAGLSTRHTLALTNRGDATAAEIVALRDLIRDRVREVFGIGLEVEPIMLGFEK